MLPTTNLNSDVDAPEPKTAFLFGLALGAMVPLFARCKYLAQRKRNGMSKRPPAEAPVIISGDWSTGFNATSSSSMTDAKLVAQIGERLREYYNQLAGEPLPQSLVEISRPFGTNKLEGPTPAAVSVVSQATPMTASKTKLRPVSPKWLDWLLGRGWRSVTPKWRGSDMRNLWLQFRAEASAIDAAGGMALSSHRRS